MHANDGCVDHLHRNVMGRANGGLVAMRPKADSLCSLRVLTPKRTPDVIVHLPRIAI